MFHSQTLLKWKLSAQPKLNWIQIDCPEATVEHSSILLENDKDLDVVCAGCLKRGNQTELLRCAGFLSFSAKTDRYQIGPLTSRYVRSKPATLTDKAHFVHRTSCEGVL